MSIGGLPREWLMEQIVYDKSYVDNLISSYGAAISDLWRHFQKNNSMTTNLFTIPNEVLDFIDGNGFLVRCVGNNVNITIVPK